MPKKKKEKKTNRDLLASSYPELDSIQGDEPSTPLRTDDGGNG